MLVKAKKEELIPFSTKIKKSLKNALVDYSERSGVSLIRIVEDALISELQKRKTGKA